MLICCDLEIRVYRIFGVYIPAFHLDEGDEIQVREDGPLFFRYGGIFKPMAFIECPKCRRNFIYSINAPILEDMQREDNRDLWDKAEKIRQELARVF